MTSKTEKQRKQAKACLDQAAFLGREIDSKLRTLQALNDSATRGAAALSRSPGGNGSGRALENAVIQMTDLQDRINEDILHLVEKKREIYDAIELVKSLRSRNILNLHYVEGMTWREVANNLGVTERTLRRLRVMALDEFAEALERRRKDTAEAKQNA